MEAFYDGDLKDIWESELDPTQSLKISTDTDMNDWFQESKFKDYAVILNDKLMSDALLNGTLPIKSEHSYSLNSDGDSLPESPGSLHNKIDDMEDECYPAISLKTATLSNRYGLQSQLIAHNVNTPIDPKSLLLTAVPASASMSPSHNTNSCHSISSNSNSNSNSNTSSSSSTPAYTSMLSGRGTNPALNCHTVVPATTSQATQAANLPHNQQQNQLSFNRLASLAKTYNLRALEHDSTNANNNNEHKNDDNDDDNDNDDNDDDDYMSEADGNEPPATYLSKNAHKQDRQYILQKLFANNNNNNNNNSNNNNNNDDDNDDDDDDDAAMMDNDCNASMASTDDNGSASTDICSDIEIDESCIKDEPLTPGSSYPPSPDIKCNNNNNNNNNNHSHHNHNNNHNDTISMPTPAKLAANNQNINAKNSSSFSLTMGNIAAFTNSDLVFEHKNGCLQLTAASQQLLKVQKLNLELSGTTSGGVKSKNLVIPKINAKCQTVSKKPAGGGLTYGLPLTPPSSIPSDESEGNTTPEHLVSPLSPNTNSLAANANVNNSNANANQSTTHLESKTRTLFVGAASTAPPRNSSSAVTRNGNNNNNNNNNGAINSNSSNNNKSGLHYHQMTSATTSMSSASSTSSSSSSSSCAFRSVAQIGANNGVASSTRQPIHTPLISSQPKGSTGILILTEEEKRTLLAEGYPIPQQLPLSKAEEKSLKKIRRKIKNKISAQESRRKKKEYMDQLERRVEILLNENNEYKKRIESLENSNISLLDQLHKLQSLIAK